MRALLVVVFLLTTLLAGCGTVVDGGLVIRTADPAVSLFVPVAQVPAAPTAEPEVLPEEEVGDPEPEPPIAPPCEEIKGNISSSGEKIYHLPGGASYNQVKINEDAGETWFCSAEEAEAAGWRKALR
jgi:hypothetical protein